MTNHREIIIKMITMQIIMLIKFLKKQDEIKFDTHNYVWKKNFSVRVEI